MANITLGGLPVASSVALGDLLHVSQSGIDRQATGQKIVDLINSDIDILTPSGGGNVTPTKSKTIITVDVSVSDQTITLNAGTLAGQTVHVKASGSGILTLTGGNGIYVNDIFITSNTGGAHLEWDGTEWDAVNEITAKYTVGVQKIILGSQRYMKIVDTDNYVTDINGSFSITYAKPFASIDDKRVSHETLDTTEIWDYQFSTGDLTSLSVTTFFVNKDNTTWTNAATSKISFATEGDY